MADSAQCKDVGSWTLSKRYTIRRSQQLSTVFVYKARGALFVLICAAVLHVAATKCIATHGRLPPPPQLQPIELVTLG